MTALSGAVWLFTLILAGCADGLAPLTVAPAPQELVATSLRPGVVQLRWKPVIATTGSVASYVIERRIAPASKFVEVARVQITSGALELTWIDTDVAPQTVYGYRVLAQTDLGDRSPPSVVGGVVTPPPPGIDIITLSTSTTSEALDPDGYQVSIMGPDTVRATVNGSAVRRFSPLRTGRYTIELSGLIARCSGSRLRQEIEVTDTTARTISAVTFDVTCRDPNRGEFTVATTVTGDSLDREWTIDVLGQAADTTVPAADRVFSRTVTQTGGAPSTGFTNLLPGTYNVKILNVAGNCSVSGSAERTISVAKESVATVAFAVTCVGSAPVPPPVSNAPFVWRNRWNPRTAAPGSTVLLESSLDLTARAGQTVKGVQGVFRFDPAALRFEDAEDGQLPTQAINSSIPGQISVLAAVSASTPARTGVVGIIKLRFTVLGAAGTKVVSRLTAPQASSQQVLGQQSVPIDSLLQVANDTLTVGTGGATPNQPPVAQFTGPTTGVVNAALAFNGSGSSDPDGTIASYSWNFGDNTSAAVASPNKTYTAAGTYSITLTVTDNGGATATRTGSITITAGTTPPPPPSGTAPVARANGPYTAQVGVPLTLSSAGSTNATSFSWALGNGQTATGASPTVTYPTAGTYTIVLTATGASGATNTSQTTATISAAPPPPPPPSNTTPLVWRNLFQAYDLANNSVALQIVYDLNANVTETPGPEALRSFVVDSLKWDTSKLQFLSLNYGPGMVDVSTNQTGVSSGRLALRASTTPGLDQGNLVIATIRFRPVGTAGQAATTSTFLGPLLGTPATGSFSYNSKTSIIEGQFTIP